MTFLCCCIPNSGVCRRWLPWIIDGRGCLCDIDAILAIAIAGMAFGASEIDVLVQWLRASEPICGATDYWQAITRAQPCMFRGVQVWSTLTAYGCSVHGQLRAVCQDSQDRVVTLQPFSSIPLLSGSHKAMTRHLIHHHAYCWRAKRARSGLGYSHRSCWSRSSDDRRAVQPICVGRGCVALIVTTACGYYSATHFAINTDINKLIAPNLTGASASKRTRGISGFVRVDHGGGGCANGRTCHRRHGQAVGGTGQAAPTSSMRSTSSTARRFSPRTACCFSRKPICAHDAGTWPRAPIIGALAGDPSLPGLTRALSFALLGVQSGQVKLEDLLRAFTMSADTIDRCSTGQPATFSWQHVCEQKPATERERRHFIDVLPMSRTSTALQPGQAASDAIRKAARDLNL